MWRRIICVYINTLDAIYHTILFVTDKEVAPGFPISTIADEKMTKTSKGVCKRLDSKSKLYAPIALGFTQSFHPSPVCTCEIPAHGNRYCAPISSNVMVPLQLNFCLSPSDVGGSASLTMFMVAYQLQHKGKCTCFVRRWSCKRIAKWKIPAIGAMWPVISISSLACCAMLTSSVLTTT